MIQKIVVLAQRDNITVDRAKGQIMGLSHVGYARIKMMLQEISKALPTNDRRLSLATALVEQADMITQWIGLGPARAAHHREVCWYVHQVRSKYRRGLGMGRDGLRSSAGIILQICLYQETQMRLLDEANLLISNIEYDKIIPVLRILSDPDDSSAGLLLYNVTQVCDCEQTTCLETYLNRKTVYLERWLQCVHAIDSVATARFETEACDRLETRIGATFGV
jgi:hypothetical protein